MARKPKDPINYSDNAARDFTVTRTGGYTGLGRRWVMIRCPFCKAESQAYIWSISGGGKRCETRTCRAMFTSHGVARPVEGREI